MLKAMKLTFWGAARAVTGSMHQLQIQGKDYLLDCGQYQGKRKEAEDRNQNFPFQAKDIQAVILSHAHIDHSGSLPLLVKRGFSGPIFTSPATADLCRPMLMDSGNLQERDAMFVNKREQRRAMLGAHGGGKPAGQVQPLYTVQDAERTLPLFRPVRLHTPTEIGPGLRYESFEAGHMLGSTTMALSCSENGRAFRLGFSGDVGRPGLPIIRDPEPMPPVENLILESTYGDRFHAPIHSVDQHLEDVVNRTCARGGKMIVPAFAVGRSQQLVVVLHQLINANRIPSFPIFVDSPLAVNVTDVFRRHPELFDKETCALLEGDGDPFGFARLTYIRDVEASKALNDLRGPFMVISASGMCEGGRVLHHLRNNIGDARNTILLTGYQAEQTLGRKLLDGWKDVPIFGDMMPVRAQVEKLDELSGHADQKELLDWIQPIAGGLKRIFLVHGEGESQPVFAKAITARYGIPVLIPQRGESFEL